MVPIVPDSFLGGSAPHLRSLVLDGIPFPDLPKLLLSATHLVYLHLYNIPHSGYISPDAVVTALSTLTNLNSLVLEFQSPRSHRDHASRPPPPLHTVLAILTHFHFKGVHEYLDDLMARIDAPQLFNLKITFFNDIVFDAPQFTQFISRTPTMKQVENTHVVFGNHRGIVNSSSPTSGCEVEILCIRVGLASFVSRAALCPALSSLFHLGGPVHLRAPVWGATRLARQHREHAVARSITPI